MSDQFTAHIGVDVDLSGLDQLQAKVDSFSKKKVKIDVQFDKAAISALDNLKVKDVKSKITVDSSDIKKVKTDFQMLKNAANELNSKKIQLANLELKPEKNANQISALSTQIKHLESDYKSLHNTFGQSLDASQIGQLESGFGKTADKIKLLEGKSKDLQKAMEIASKASEKVFDGNRSVTASNNTLSWLDRNSKAAKKYGEQLKELATLQSQATNSADLSLANNSVKAIQSQARAEGLMGQTFTQQIASNFNQVGQIAASYLTLQQGIRLAKSMANEVIAVDSAMIELRKVSTAPAGDITNYFKSATASAKEYGASISDVIETTADWSRLGYGLSDAAWLSDQTTLLQKIGDNMTRESSSEALIATLKGFQMDAKESTRIVDMINEVANTQPIDTRGIAEALQRSSASLSAAGNTLEQSIGMITAANSVVQNPEVVGTALRTLSMRIRGAKTEMEALGEDTDGMAESTAKLQKEMLALSGIDIMKDKNTFKDTYQILDELSYKWQDLTDIQQANKTCLCVQKCA